MDLGFFLNLQILRSDVGLIGLSLQPFRLLAACLC